MIRIFLLLLALSQIGCVVAAKNPYNNNTFAKLQAIKIGDPIRKITDTFGPPTQIVEEKNYRLLEYRFPYKGYNLPRIIVSTNSSEKILRLIFHVYEEFDGKLTSDKVLEPYRDVKFREYDPYDHPKKHYISSDRVLENHDIGLSLEHNPRRDKAVSWINWYRPLSTTAKVSSVE